jgi:uncharacterized protein
MGDQRFTRTTRIDAPASALFAWHARPGALERLVPPWQSVAVIDRTGAIDDGRVVLLVGPWPFRRRWVAEHRPLVGEREVLGFRDVQVEGPMARWEHAHHFRAEGSDASLLEDCIDYRLPLGFVGNRVAGPVVRRMLARTFEYRHRITADDVARHTRREEGPMQIAVSGATGLIGSALVPFLMTGGHGVTHLVRGRPTPGANDARWDPAAGEIDSDALRGIDAAVHLSGESVAEGRWNEGKKARIRESRIDSTRLLSETLARLDPRPRVLVCASAVGIYGDRGDELLTEDSEPGNGFLADLTREWEASSQAARDAGIRVVNVRFGIVLSARGGALRTMLLPFRLGVGGPLGSGRQWMSWVAIDDVIGAIQHALMTEELEGPVNVTAPNPETNRDFSRTLGRVLRRPAVMRVPLPVLRIALGEFADDAVSSQRAMPTRLEQTGFQFSQPELEGALRHVLGK